MHNIFELWLKTNESRWKRQERENEKIRREHGDQLQYVSVIIWFCFRWLLVNRLITNRMRQTCLSITEHNVLMCAYAIQWDNILARTKRTIQMNPSIRSF